MRGFVVPAPAYVGVLLYAVACQCTDITNDADVATLDPTVKINVGGNEIGGAVLMGGAAPGGKQNAFIAQAAQAALERAARDVHLPAKVQNRASSQNEKKQLGESSKAKKLEYTYENPDWDKWPKCTNGIKQSPIDLVRPWYGAFNKLKMLYKDQLWPVQENDGTVIKVPFKGGDGSVLGIGDKEYRPVEAIFRVPSEHKLDGRSFDMEMQIMHIDSIGNKVGMAVLMQVSDKIPEDNFYIQNGFSHFFQDLPETGNKRRVEALNLKWILNEEMMHHYVTYHGSLTHPPCTEGVEWFILGRPWLVEKQWLDNYKKAIPNPNARPAQPQGNRLIKSF